MTNPSLTHTHTHTNKAHPQTYANLLCDTRLEAHVSHANETDPASSRQHVDVLHRRASLQKLKSFSPPSPVMVTVMGRRCAIILSPSHCKRIKNLSLCLVFFSLNKEKQAQIQISNTVPVISLPHIYWIKPIREVTEFCLIPMRNVIRQSFCRLWGSGMSQWSRLCISQVIVSPIKIHRHLTGNV